MKMLIRMLTLSLGAMIAFSSAEAAPPKTKKNATGKPTIEAPEWRARVKPPSAALSQRTTPPIGVQSVTPMTQPVVEEARIEKFEEGMIFYSVLLSEESREAIARHKGIPLSRVPDRGNKMARVDYRSLTHRQIKDKVGDDVVLELRQDPYGYIYVTSLSAKKRK